MTDLIKLAQECGAKVYHDGEPGHDKNYPWIQFMSDELQQFAQALQRPLLNQIENQRLNCEAAYRYAFVMRDIAIQRDARIEQLETAWRPPLTDRRIRDLLPDFQNGWSVVDYGMWVARAVERARGIGGGA